MPTTAYVWSPTRMFRRGGDDASVVSGDERDDDFAGGSKSPVWNASSAIRWNSGGTSAAFHRSLSRMRLSLVLRSSWKRLTNRAA